MNWTCPLCEQTFATHSNLSNHEATHRRPVPCSLCGTRIKNIRGHYRRYHGVSFNAPTVEVLTDQNAAELTYPKI